MINTQQLFDACASKFGVAKSSDRFLQKFIEAVNSVSLDLATYQIVQPQISSLNDNLILNDQYKHAYLYGTEYFLQFCKEWGITPVPEAEVRYRRALGLSQALYFIDNPPYTRADEVASTSTDETL